MARTLYRFYLYFVFIAMAIFAAVALGLLLQALLRLTPLIGMYGSRPSNQEVVQAIVFAIVAWIIAGLLGGLREREGARTGNVTAATQTAEREPPRDHESDSGAEAWDEWAMRDLNPRPRACEARALTS